MSHSDASTVPAKASGDVPRQIGDIWQGLGISGDWLGTGGICRRTFWYGVGATAVFAGVVNLLNVITVEHAMPRLNPLEPLIWEGSSWLSLLLFFWIAWIFWRLAPLNAGWRLLLHVPGALLYSTLHIGGFIVLRSLGYWMLGGRYHFGRFWPQFTYELGKDVLSYFLFVTGFALIEHLLRQQRLIQVPGQCLTFDIRDGAKLTRVALADILAVSSAGNYVEFALTDGRKLLMRRPLSAVESDLAGRGFVRTHRSWLVNETAVTGLKPEGSGDYDVSLGSLNVPLSRRFPDALTRLWAGTPPKPLIQDISVDGNLTCVYAAAGIIAPEPPPP